MPVSRRSLLTSVSAAALFIPVSSIATARVWAQAPVPLDPAYPTHAPALAREFVGVSHGNIARVRELLAVSPELAKASWDWGWGDWETALGAASHVGNTEIATLLLEAGAPPTIFSAAMLGQLDIVKALVSAMPGVQRRRGPHGLTLLSHARAGGEAAAPVRAWLEALGDADPSYDSATLADADRDALPGRYAWGAGPTDAFIVELHPRLGPTIARDASSPRRLVHLGDRVFLPVGAESVRIAFGAGSPAASVAVTAGGAVVTGRR